MGETEVRKNGERVRDMVRNGHRDERERERRDKVGI